MPTKKSTNIDLLEETQVNQTEGWKSTNYTLIPCNSREELFLYY